MRVFPWNCPLTSILSPRGEEDSFDLCLKEMGSFFGNWHYTAVSAAFRRAKLKPYRDKGFNTALKKIGTKIGVRETTSPRNVSCQDLTPIAPQLSPCLHTLKTTIEGLHSSLNLPHFVC